MRSLLDRVRAHAADAGLNLMGLVDCGRFDAGEPKERRISRVAPACGTIVVLGSGGRSIPPPLGCTGQGAATIAGWANAAAGSVASLMREHGVACRALPLDGGCRVNGARLGEAAGFGTVSPVSGLLLHPEYGPWLRVRVAMLCDGSPFGAIGDASISERFQPCCTCDRPCVRACPAAVHDHRDRALAACASHRHGGGCTGGCASRDACPIGTQHRDEPAVALHGHSHELATLQRWYGLGPWRLVPKQLRGGP